MINKHQRDLEDVIWNLEDNEDCEELALSGEITEHLTDRTLLNQSRTVAGEGWFSDPGLYCNGEIRR